MEHCAFDLHPGIPLEGQTIPWPPERMAQARKHFEQVAQAEGLAYGTRSHWYNSGPAHQAAIWADAQDPAKGDALRRAVYRAYFVDDLNIASHEVLVGIARDVGLDGDELRQALQDETYKEEVERQFQLAREVGVNAVPAYVAGKYLLVGAQPLEVYRQLIETAQSEAEGTA